MKILRIFVPLSAAMLLCTGLCAGQDKGVSVPFGGEVALYDLQKDIGEQNDVARMHPDVIARIRAAMKEAHVPSPLWKLPGSPQK